MTTQTLKRGHDDVAIFWKQTLDDFVSPLKIDSDRIVGIQIEALDQDPLFILSVYLPSSNHKFTEFCECLDLLWSLCEIYINKGPFILMGDFNAQVRNIGGTRRFGHLNNRGKKLIEFLDFFNLILLNLSELACGPLHTFMSDDERNKPVFDFIIFPATFISKVFSCKEGEWKCDLLSDHVPISASLVDCLHLNSINSQPIQKVQFEKKKVKWDSYDKESIQSLYTEPLSVKLSEISFDTGIDELYNSLLIIVWSVSEAGLKVKRICTGKKPEMQKNQAYLVSKSEIN